MTLPRLQYARNNKMHYTRSTFPATMPCMKQDHARQIIALLGWTQAEAARQYNRVSGGKKRHTHISDMLNGPRGVSESFAVFLRMSLRLAVLRKRLAR